MIYDGLRIVINKDRKLTGNDISGRDRVDKNKSEPTICILVSCWDGFNGTFCESCNHQEMT